MKPLTMLSTALVMALALGGPVAFTSAPAHAGDLLSCSAYRFTNPGQSVPNDCADGLLEDLAFGFITPAHAGDLGCSFRQCHDEDGTPYRTFGLIEDLEMEQMK
ncbi:MAG: hypothetical protein V6Z81_10345 [Parvularculales bacterium]